MSFHVPVRRRLFLAGIILCGLPAFCLAQKAEAPKLPVPDAANVSYGPHERNVLDLWLAKSETPASVMVFIHGGGFHGGDKSSLAPRVLELCLKDGISVASVNYRLSPGVHFPAHFMDCVRAIQTLRHRAKEWNLDPTRIAATGGSAGAGTALWIGFHDDLADPDNADPVLRESTRLSGMAVLGAQTTYDPRAIKTIIGEAAARHPSLPGFYGIKLTELDSPRAHEMYVAASPITYLTKDDPPAWLYYAEPKGPLPENAKPGQGIHHVNFGTFLKEKMDPLEIECIVRHKDDGGDPQAELVEFLRKHLQKKSP